MKIINDISDIQLQNTINNIFINSLERFEYKWIRKNRFLCISIHKFNENTDRSKYYIFEKEISNLLNTFSFQNIKCIRVLNIIFFRIDIRKKETLEINKGCYVFECFLEKISYDILVPSKKPMLVVYNIHKYFNNISIFYKTSIEIYRKYINYDYGYLDNIFEVYISSKDLEKYPFDVYFQFYFYFSKNHDIILKTIPQLFDDYTKKAIYTKINSSFKNIDRIEK